MNRIVQNISEFPAIAERLRASRIAVADTETSGLSPHNGDRIAGISVGPLESDENYYFPIRHAAPRSLTACKEQSLFTGVRFQLLAMPLELNNLPLEPTLEFFRALFADPELCTVWQNGKYDKGMLRSDKIEVAGPIYDTMLWGHAADGSRYKYNLEALTKWLVPEFSHAAYVRLCDWFQEHQGVNLRVKKVEEGEEPPNYSFAPIKTLGEYAMEDLQATRLVCKALMAKPLMTAKPKNFGNVAYTQEDYIKSEQQLMPVVFEMENRGVLLDMPKLTRLYEKTQDEIEYHSEKLYELCGYSFNVGSWKQIWTAFESVGGKVFFWSKKKAEQGKQKADKYTENYELSNKRPCWNSSAFAKYFERLKAAGNQRAYDFVFHYYQADHRMRLSATYLETMLQKKDVNDVLHPSLNSHGTKTGRFSSSNPNCQNISKAEGNADLKKLEKIIGYQEDALNRQMRDLFIPRPGYTWVKFDYKQIEYVIATYLSQDLEMIQRFWDDPNLDYHQITADLALITRDQAKTVNFGTLYGMGAKSLAAMLGISKSEAQSMLDRLFSARPALKQLINRMSEESAKNKYVYLPFGCVVPVDPEKGYVGLNAWVQGTASLMMKRQMIVLRKEILKHRWPAEMLLQVHDELDFEIKNGLVNEIAPQIATVLCDVQDVIKMPVTCDIEYGESWGNLVELPWTNPWIKTKKEAA